MQENIQNNNTGSFQVNSIGKITRREDGVFLQVEERYLPALQALDGFSHLIVIWWFSEHDNEEARKILEMPAPYKHAPEIMGVFATRSPVRPNPIALTTVKVISIDYKAGFIHIDDIDANNDTPLLDIKPYTPCTDRVETPGLPTWCSHWPKSMETTKDFDWAGEFNFPV